MDTASNFGNATGAAPLLNTTEATTLAAEIARAELRRRGYSDRQIDGMRKVRRST
jgi:hypothetical protein